MEIVYSLRKLTFLFVCGANVNLEILVIFFFHLIRRREWQPIPVFLPREFHGQRILVGYSPWGHKESDTTLPVYTDREDLS